MLPSSASKTFFVPLTFKRSMELDVAAETFTIRFIFYPGELMFLKMETFL